MHAKSAAYYDRIYSFKDYAVEARHLLAIIAETLGPGRKSLLDVACGTGRHVEFLALSHAVEGLDASPEMLDFARRRNPGVPFHVGDFVDFDLGKTFDVVTCLFSSIGYVRTPENLVRAVASMARHVAAGGLLIVEPWFTPGAAKAGGLYATFVDDPDLKLARINTTRVDARLSSFDFHYLVGTPAGTEHFVERHELGLFEVEETKAAFAAAGLETLYDPQGLTGRGLFIGRRPAA